MASLTTKFLDRGRPLTTSSPDSSQYANGGISTCALTSLNACREILTSACAEVSKLGDAPLERFLEGSVRELIDRTVAICRHWTSPAHLEVDFLYKNLPLFNSSMDLYETLAEEWQATSLRRLLSRMVEIAKATPARVVAGVLTKSPEVVCVFVMATGEINATYPSYVFGVFDSHPRPLVHPDGAGVILFPTAPSALGYLKTLFPVAPTDSGERQDLGWQELILSQYDASLFVPKSPPEKPIDMLYQTTAKLLRYSMSLDPPAYGFDNGKSATAASQSSRDRDVSFDEPSSQPWWQSSQDEQFERDRQMALDLAAAEMAHQARNGQGNRQGGRGEQAEVRGSQQSASSSQSPTKGKGKATPKNDHEFAMALARSEMMPGSYDWGGNQSASGQGWAIDPNLFSSPDQFPDQRGFNASLRSPEWSPENSKLSNLGITEAELANGFQESSLNLFGRRWVPEDTVSKVRSTMENMGARAGASLSSVKAFAKMEDVESEEDRRRRLDAEFEASARLVEQIQQEDFDNSFLCQICQDPHHIEDRAIVDGCNHEFCREQLGGYISSKLGERTYPIRCPECMANKKDDEKAFCGEISHQLVSLVMGEDDFRTFEKLAVLWSFGTEASCPSCHQTTIFDTEDLQQVVQVPCPNCGDSWCRRCGGAMESEATHKCVRDTEFETMAEEAGWKNCPGCTFKFEKSEGCNHMTCLTPNCNMHFCYVCGGAIIKSVVKNQIQAAVNDHFRGDKCRLFDVPAEQGE